MAGSSARLILWGGGAIALVALTALAFLAERAWLAGHPQLAVVLDGTRLPAYWAWAFGVYRACDASTWAPLVRASIVAGAVLTALT